jgi:hypothetical protein
MFEYASRQAATLKQLNVMLQTVHKHTHQRCMRYILAYTRTSVCTHRIINTRVYITSTRLLVADVPQLRQLHIVCAGCSNQRGTHSIPPKTAGSLTDAQLQPGTTQAMPSQAYHVLSALYTCSCRRCSTLKQTSSCHLQLLKQNWLVLGALLPPTLATQRESSQPQLAGKTLETQSRRDTLAVCAAADPEAHTRR